MPNILVINSGSTSVKFKVFDAQEKCLKEGCANEVHDFNQALKNILRQIGGVHDLAAVGHRVVHGGDRFFKPLVLDEKSIAELEQFNELAPLHNPFNLAGIKAAKEFLPDVPEVAVFDTGFYESLPEVAKNYALPHELMERFKLRRYGFHGISHEYVSIEGAKKLGLDYKRCNLITCHLGGGWSITAIKNGKSIDTSMGFTPMEGLIMMTRSGDIDPGVIFTLLRKEWLENSEKLSDREEGLKDDNNWEKMREKVENILNHDSGIKGISGGIDNYLELLKGVSLGKVRAKKAFDMAVYRLVKYIGSYAAALGGQVDGLIFTGRIGAGKPATRNAVINKVKFLNAPVIAIDPNEEALIARKTISLLNIK